jgi:hypothetical protein
VTAVPLGAVAIGVVVAAFGSWIDDRERDRQIGARPSATLS